MWVVNAMKTDYERIGFVEYKFPNLIAPGSYTNWCHLSGPAGCPFFACRISTVGEVSH